MFDALKKEITIIRILIFLGIATLGIHLFKIVWDVIGNFSDILIILIISWLLSFIFEPLVDRITQFTKLPKAFITLILYLFLLMVLSAAIFLFIPAVALQIKALTEIIPRYLETAPSFVNKWSDMFITSLNNSISLIPSVAQFFFSVFIVLIISFYLIVDKEKINEELLCLVPSKWHDNISFFQKVVNNSFISFFRVQLIFGVISGFVTWIILRIFSIDFAASIALLAGIFAAIPLVGPVLSIIPPVFLALITDPTKAIIIFIILLIIQQFIFNVLGPKLLGGAFRIHPIIVLISFLIGYKIAGGLGSILAIPVLGILTVVIRELGKQFIKAIK